MKILIIDDDIAFAKKLEKDLFNYLSLLNDRTEFHMMQDNFDNISKSDTYDVVFLDIDLPDNNGIEIAKKIKRLGITDKIIFVTSYSHLVFEAFTVHPYFFVRKNEFEKDIKVVYDFFSLNNYDHCFIKLKKNRETIMLSTDKIVYVEINDHVLTIHTRDNVYEDSSRTLKQLLLELEQENFVQIHKSFVINLDYLLTYDNSGIHLNDGVYLLFGKKYKELFMNKYMEYLVK